MTKPLCIAQLSDLHLKKNDDDVIYGAKPNLNLKQVLAHLHDIEHELDAVLISGDLAQDLVKESYQNLLNAVSNFEWQIPFYWFTGNHDDESLAKRILDSTPFICLDDTKSASLGLWQLVHLDTRKPLSRSQYKGEGEISNSDVADLQALLSLDSQRFTVLAFHHHLVPFHSFIDKYSVDKPSGFEACLRQNEQVKLLVHGHVHASSHGTFAGKDWYSCPATCYEYKHNTAEFDVIRTTPGYNLLRLSASGEHHIETRWL